MGLFDAPRSPDCFSVPPLDYAKPRCAPSTNTCVMVAVAFLVLYMLHTSPQKPMHQPMYAMHHGLSTMIAQVEKAMGGSDCIDAHKVFPDVPARTIDLADAKDAPKDANAYQTSSAEEKKALEDAARRWMAAENRAIIMIFAHWCPHCKATIPALVEASKKLKCKTLMINADALPPSAFVGDQAIHDLKYFPTILVKKGDAVTQASSMSEVARELEPPEAAPKAAAAEADPATSAAEEATDMLDKLF